MKRLHVVPMLLCAALLFAAGCRKPEEPRLDEPSEQPAEPASLSGDRLDAQYQFAEETGFSVDLGDRPEFTPSVKPYTLRSDLSNVKNLRLFTDRIKPAHISEIADKGFVVVAADWKKMEFVYEQNNYPEEHWPSFITTDSILHTYHIFYDYMLRIMEVTQLYERAETLSKALVKQTAARYEASEIDEVKAAARDNFAYAVVPARLLEIPDADLGVTIPDEVEELVQQELNLIDQHGGFTPSPTVGFKVDYSQFVPRGHYTRSEKLKRYFKALMWYGLTPMALRNIRNEFAPHQARQAVLMADAILYGTAGDEPIGKVWEDLYEPTAFMVGFADDNTPADYGQVIPDIFGDPIEAQKLVPQDNLEELAERVLAMRPPGIVMASVTGDRQLPGIPQFRVMGQRFVLDSHIFQMMVLPHVKRDPATGRARTFPMGLDVMAALGSERAYEILDTVYEQPKFEDYDKMLGEMRNEVEGLSGEDWTSNVYYGWLQALKFLTEEKRDGYPTFMQSDAWLDKQLNSALGSWAELRHDTILYAKQSVVAECGGEGGEKEPPPPPKGYVEPEVLTYWRLKLLATQLRNGLAEREMLENENLQRGFDSLIEMLAFLERTSIKELTGETLTAEEYRQIEFYGDDIARMMLQVTQGSGVDEISSTTDKDMAVVADVHTGPIGSDMFALEEGVGHASEIYAVYPCEGDLLMGRGACFSYYEFTQPIANRLTDEKWQEMLGSSNPPAMPKWVTSFLSTVPLEGETGANIEGGRPAFTGGGC